MFLGTAQKSLLEGGGVWGVEFQIWPNLNLLKF